MKFRVPEDGTENIRIASTSGHVVCLIAGEDWRDNIPVEFHSKLIAAGAEFEKTKKGEKVDPKDGQEKTNQSLDADPAYAAAIRKAINTMVERQEDGDFTGDKLPNTNVVASLAGIKVKKTDVLAIFRTMQVEAGVPGVDAAGDDAGGEGDEEE